ncbi:N-6 adenine specific DNA methyltransferase [Candidatus Phytoplasma mali]|uniref:N-6 adenine specific DNA methyltransferase n=1 Tax=Phytoplasma mali (strain AT) TaxID=482235 RepID=B3QZP3_PHYMT|nr:16S rRNA (guanine(966)-N(2))-methyltransferase RsmD [Candidatus Phytoplasma mali]CAP18430.1 N-6 adenine specific DNA methyltransferase [Candidatus Phytoplasma mali]
MYIISGKYKGFKLKSVPSATTRSTTHLIRKVIFDTLGSWLENKYVLDLFSGSGACGFEALSRNAKKIYLVDNSLSAIKTIYKNKIKLNLTSSNFKLFFLDYSRILKIFFKKKIFFDLIIIDPPYNFNFYLPLLKNLNFIIKDNGFIVCEIDKRVILPNNIDQLTLIKDKQHGSKKIKFYQKKKNKV